MLKVFQLFMRTNNYEPNDVEVKTHLDLRDRPDAIKHSCVDAEIMGTLAIMSTREAINVAGIVVGDPIEWLTLLVNSGNKIYNFFDDCAIPFYEWLLTRI